MARVSEAVNEIFHRLHVGTDADAASKLCDLSWSCLRVETVDPDELDRISDAITAELAEGCDVLVHSANARGRAPLALTWHLAKTRFARTFHSAYCYVRMRHPITEWHYEWLPKDVVERADEELNPHGSWTDGGTLATAAELYSATTEEIPILVPPPYAPCNPSVHFDGWQWRCSVRAVDYRLGGPQGKGSTSRNFLLSLDSRLHVEDVVELVDRSGYPRKAVAMVRGFEDLRLFSRQGHLAATASSCDLDGGVDRAPGWGIPEICALDLGPNGTIDTVRPMRGPWSDIPQKNWMPVQDGIGTTALYRAWPSLRVDLETGQHAGDERAFLPASLRGSSQLVRMGDGWLAVMHESSRRPLSYRHRFVWFDRDFQLCRASKDFVWRSPGVEFCAGLATDGKRLVASFGVHDQAAYLAALEPSEVMASLHDLRY